MHGMRSRWLQPPILHNLESTYTSTVGGAQIKLEQTPTDSVEKSGHCVSLETLHHRTLRRPSDDTIVTTAPSPCVLPIDYAPANCALTLKLNAAQRGSREAKDYEPEPD